MRAETARYAAQTANDFAAMEKLFGNDLTYNHSSAATDDKAKYIEAMRSGRTKYRKMTPNSDVTTRTYGCLAIITGDRKSTRLNSSHVSISYAVFCLKKKKTPLDPPSNTVSSAQD